MQTIYVLLRNDKQTGPYSLEEIIQFDLKPYDLIWIEGKSAGWWYPQEIAALHPYLSFLPQKPKPALQANAAEKKVFVSMPSTPEKKHEPVVPKAERIAGVWKAEVPKEIARPLTPASENLEQAVYAQFSHPAKKEEPRIAGNATTPQKKKSPNAVAVGITTVLIVGGVFAASWVMNRQPAEEETSNGTTAAPVTNEVVNAPVAKDDKSKNTQFTAATKQALRRSNNGSKTPAFVHRNAPSAQATQTKEEQEPVSSKDVRKGADEEAAVEPQRAETKPTGENTTAPDEPSVPQEKKKKLRDKIFDIFRKKPDETKVEDTKPTPAENAERQSTRRESGANLAQLVHIRFTVPNDWMMGIKGAKATLVNRSSETITSATVEILYYNDDNELLQKKTVSFRKINGKESQTISIPDHSTATRVDYTIVSVTGKPAA